MSVVLHLGDCLDFLRTLKPGSVDAVVTDPPYGMNWDTDTTRFSGGQAPNNRARMQGIGRGQGRDDWGAVLGDDKPFDPSPWMNFPQVILWGANHYWQALPTGTTLVWIKKADHLFGTFLSDAEIGWMKGGYGVYCFRKQFPPSSRMHEGNGKVLHPTQKPIALMRWCIERVSQPGDTILDPFMGSGTTGVACVQTGRSFIGCEISAEYFKVAQKRIAQAEMQPRLLPVEQPRYEQLEAAL
jgi:site-specific DNA-methyltransferase (adenine-specific)